MSVAFDYPSSVEAQITRALDRLTAAGARFVELERDAHEVTEWKLYHEVLAAVHEICAAAVDCEMAGVEREDIIGVLGEVRRIHARSPFVDRLQRWPRGYPGDFQTVEYICRAENRARRQTIEYQCEQYALTRGIAQQHRNKVALQTRRIIDTMLEKPRNSRIFSMACGSCPDLRSIPRIEEIAGELWLNDSDTDALAFAMGELPQIHERIKVVPGNVVRVAKRIAVRTEERFDLVLAGGLFDYLPEETAIYLIETALNGLLLRGGTFFFTNIASGNPYRPLIEYLGDWFLIERSEEELMRYCLAAGARPEEVRIMRDATGLAFVVEVKRA
jgi:extracellular factor (EF) 3-hydroxypalmitic acid methyl ester biosynthesis protein